MPSEDPERLTYTELQIPFYKRGGFLEIYAYVRGGAVKPSIAKSIS
jgi:hypothetical protein